MMVKVCGMRSPENIRAVARSGAHMMGFIFYPGSPRYFQGTLPELPSRLKTVGVFVNASIETMTSAALKYGLDYLQLHGDESPETCRNLQIQLQNQQLKTRLIKVFSIGSEADLPTTSDYEGLVSYYLFDTKGKYRGGNGTPFNWKLLEKYQQQTPFLLSGGIAPNDIQTLDGFMKSRAGQYCAGIDINSGFETAPGMKDAARVEQFIEHINRLSRKNNA